MLPKRQAIMTMLAWAMIPLAHAVFGAACFALLRLTTDLPLWAALLISIPVAIAGFRLFACSHQTNGFDGPMISIDELQTKLDAMSPQEQTNYLAQFSETDRHELLKKLKPNKDPSPNPSKTKESPRP